jgi:hypothetical protein
MKTDFTFDNSRALATQELESVSGGTSFSSVSQGYPSAGFHITWSPAVLPKDKTGVAKPNGWTYEWLNG